ncbi:MAG: hypothetical protein ACRDHL_09650 [Candidatus Promineifilaceae bacterium]
MDEPLRNLALILLGLMLAALLVSSVLLLILVRQVRALNIPEGAGFTETLLYTPFLLVVALDLLDFGLDFLAAPVSWLLLDRLGLKGLRGVTTVEALIPFTQVIPALTASWLAVRYLGVRLDR